MTQAAIDDTREEYVCDGLVVAFAYPHPFELKTDLTVTVRTIATGVDQTFTHVTDYTIAATNDDYSSGATVTTTSTLQSTERLIIERNEPFSQTVDLTEAQKIPAKTLEDGLDRLCRLNQQLLTRDLRALKIPVGDLALNELPSEIDRANKILSFNSAGQPVTATLVAGTPEVDFDLTYGKEFWIDDYGADPTGVNDSQPAFVSAEALAAVAGGTVRIGVGHYAMGDECLVSDGVKVRGSGRMDQTGTSTILGTDVFPLDSFAGTRMFAQKTTGGTSSKSIAFEDMVIRGDKPGGGNISIGIQQVNGKYWLYQNLAFHFFDAQGIYISDTGSTVTAFINVFIRDAVQAVAGSETGALEIHSQDNSFYNVEATCSSTGVPSGGNAAALLLAGSAAENFFYGGQFEISETGIIVRGSGGNKFLGTRSDLNQIHGWIVYVGGNTFSGCEALNNGRSFTNLYDGFLLAAQNNLLVGCNARITTGNTHRYGFNDQSGVVGNNAEACRSTGHGTAEYNDTVHTGFWDNYQATAAADDTTPSIASTDALVIPANTNRIAITAFDDMKLGQTITLRQSSGDDLFSYINPSATFRMSPFHARNNSTITFYANSATVFNEVSRWEPQGREHHSGGRYSTAFVGVSGDGDFAAVGDHVIGYIPNNAVIVDCYYRVSTAPTSAGAATIAVGVTSDDATGIVPATAYNNAIFDTSNQGFHLGTPQKATVSTYTTKATALRAVIVTIGTAALTAGIIDFYWDYVDLS